MAGMGAPWPTEAIGMTSIEHLLPVHFPPCCRLAVTARGQPLADGRVARAGSDPEPGGYCTAQPPESYVSGPL